MVAIVGLAAVGGGRNTVDLVHEFQSRGDAQERSSRLGTAYETGLRKLKIAGILGVDSPSGDTRMVRTQRTRETVSQAPETGFRAVVGQVRGNKVRAGQGERPRKGTGEA